jgi:hypothetical protein
MADQGDPFIVPGQIGGLPAPKACSQCCFRRDSLPGCLGGYSLLEWRQLLDLPNLDIACHCSKGFEAGLSGLPTQRTCTGYARYKANSGEPTVGKLKIAVDHVGPDHGEVFSSWDEFVLYHTQPGADANKDAWKDTP